MCVRDDILTMIDCGVLDARDVVSACLKYMPLAEVQDMAEREGFIEEIEIEEEEE